MGNKRRKAKVDSKEDTVSKKAKIEGDSAVIAEIIPDVEKGIKVGNSASKLKKQKEKRKKTENDTEIEKCSNEPTTKKLKVETESSNNVDVKHLDAGGKQTELGADATFAKKKKKKKKDKQKNIITNEADGLKEDNALKGFEIETNKSEGVEGAKLIDKQQQLDADAVTVKKKKKKNKKAIGGVGIYEKEIANSSSEVKAAENGVGTEKVTNGHSSEVEIQKLGNGDGKHQSDAGVISAKRKKRKKKNKKTNNLSGVKEEEKELCSLDSSAKEQAKKKKRKKKNKKQKDETKDDPNEELFIPLSGGDESLTKKNIRGTSVNTAEVEAVLSAPAALNNCYGDVAKKEEIVQCWSEGSPLQRDNGFKLLLEPFKCMYMPSFLQDSAFLQKVKEELSTLELHKKSNDLYKFKQTSDLKSVSLPHIASLRKFLYGDFRKWLSDVTGIDLNDTVDMGSSCYEYTDVLLCHDDELEGRRVAYILYLTPPWYEKDGGMLDLFDIDNKGQPRDVVKSLLPKWNTMAFFEVSPVSFHQVREVLSRDKVRLSINGWFHGPDIKRPPKYVAPPREFLSPVHFEEDELYAWINPTYLDADTQRQIRKKFQNDSEIELESFICEEKYEELRKAMQSNMKWVGTGPANKQCCRVLKQEKLPGVITECAKFLKSEALFLILSQLTGLKLHHLAPPDSDPDSDEEDEKESADSNPGMILDIRQWGHGSYTLLRDCDQAERKSALDASLFVRVPSKWNLEHGGFTSYIAKDEDEELLTVMPRSNCLALVYRDTETLKFTKYINASVKDLGNKDSVFYEFNCTYRE